MFKRLEENRVSLEFMVESYRELDIDLMYWNFRKLKFIVNRMGFIGIMGLIKYEVFCY